MPPNRKSPTLFTNSLESLNIQIKAEFLSLTDPREAAQQQQQQQQQYQKCVQRDLISDAKTEKSLPTVSYWDWHPCSDTAEEEKVAAIDELFSLSRFESNLISDSIRRESFTAEVPVDESKDHDEQPSYWDWSNEDADVAEPDTDTRDDKRTQIDDHDHEECCDDYWAWHPNEVTEEDCDDSSPSHRLHQVVSESRKKFVRRHIHFPEPEECPISKSHHYWHWLELRRTGAK